MKTIGNGGDAILLGVGGIWCGQGAGYIRGSFMTADRKWLIIGAVVACLGVGLLIWTNSRNPCGLILVGKNGGGLVVRLSKGRKR